MVTVGGARAAGAEQRLKDLGVSLPPPPSPLGAYVAAVKVGNLLNLSGMLPVIGREPQFVGRVGSDLSIQSGYEAARLACLCGLAVAKAHIGTLDKVTGVARLCVYIATAGDFRDHAKVADGASELLLKVFGPEMLSPRMVLGVVNLPLGLPVAVELAFQVTA